MHVTFQSFGMRDRRFERSLSFRREYTIAREGRSKVTGPCFSLVHIHCVLAFHLSFDFANQIIVRTLDFDMGHGQEVETMAWEHRSEPV